MEARHLIEHPQFLYQHLSDREVIIVYAHFRVPRGQMAQLMAMAANTAGNSPTM